MDEKNLQQAKIFSLSDITGRIKQILAPSCAKTFWVRAEIASGREKAGSFYCDLVEMGPGDKLLAKMQSSIWRHDLSRIRRVFEDKGLDLKLQDGTLVVFHCRLQYSEEYGLSLKIIDADPSFALGEMEQRKREIIETLDRAGLLGLNKKKPVPALPLRIGLITSQGSAAYHDVLRTLSASGYAFEIWVGNAMVQGKTTESSVLQALQLLEKKNLDLIAVVRGGGSKSDLSWLDNEVLARAIAACPLPVWTAIGHEIDTSVLDLVANLSHKTPTAFAEALVANFVATERFLEETLERFATIWSYRLQIHKQLLERSEIGLRNGTRKHLDTTKAQLRELALQPMAKTSERMTREREGLARMFEQIKAKSARRLERAQAQAESCQRQLRAEWILHRLKTEHERLDARLVSVYANDPERQLKRGYVLLRNTQGQILTSAKGIVKGSALMAQMQDANLLVDVRNIEKKVKEMKSDDTIDSDRDKTD